MVFGFPIFNTIDIIEQFLYHNRWDKYLHIFLYRYMPDTFLSHRDTIHLDKVSNLYLHISGNRHHFLCRHTERLFFCYM